MVLVVARASVHSSAGIVASWSRRCELLSKKKEWRYLFEGRHQCAMMVLLAVMLAATRQHAIAEALDVDARGAAAAPTDGGLSVDVGTNGSYAVKVDGATWFASDDAFITCGGKVFSLKAGTLALENIERSSGSDALGTYEQTTMVLHAAATPPATVEF